MGDTINVQLHLVDLTDNAGLEEEEENMLEGSRAGGGRAGVALAS